MGPAWAHFNGSWPIPSMLRSASRRISVCAVVSGWLALAELCGCAPTVDQRGNLPDPDKLATIRPGATTKDEVVKILGTPSSIGVFNDKSWYYISRRTEQLAFLDPDVLDQQVYIVNFDDRGVVKAVDPRTLKDGREITPAPGATPPPHRAARLPGPGCAGPGRRAAR